LRRTLADKALWTLIVTSGNNTPLQKFLYFTENFQCSSVNQTLLIGLTGKYLQTDSSEGPRFIVQNFCFVFLEVHSILYTISL